MKVLQVATASSSIYKVDVSRVVRTDLLPDSLNDTILDPEILKYGYDQNLPFKVLDIFGRSIKSVSLPPLSSDGRFEKTGGLSFLNPISVAFNNILSLIEKDSNFNLIQKAVIYYYRELLLKVVGDKGSIATSVIGTRMSQSGRLVLLPQIERSPEWVGIHAPTMENANIVEGDYVIIFRDPVIWTGSLDVVRVYPINEDVIRIHPLLFAQLGADCDGDQIAFTKPNCEDTMVFEEMSKNLILFCKENASWPKRLCPPGMSSEVNWNNVVEDTKARFQVTGLSYGPRDVASWRKKPRNLIDIEAIGGKDLSAFNKKIQNNDESFYWDVILRVNEANLFMKDSMGIVGSVARKVLQITSDDPWMVPEVNLFSNIIQQKTLDAKHYIGNEGTLDTNIPSDVMNLFELRDGWDKASNSRCFELLTSAHIPESCAIKIILFFRSEIFIRLALKFDLPEEIANELSDELRNIMQESHTAKNLNPDLSVFYGNCVEAYKKILTDTSRTIDITFIKERFEEFRTGISNVIMHYYPGYCLITTKVSKHASLGDRRFNRALNSYSKVFHERSGDLNGIFSQVFPSLEE